MENLIFNEVIETILLSLDEEVVNLGIVKNFALAEKLNPKREFHITIIGRETGEVLAKINADFDAVKKLAESIDWNFSLKQEYYYIVKEYPEDEKRESIIQVVELPGLSHFYEKLNEMTGQAFAVPFPHITLYTNSTKEENKLRGIGIYSKEEMESLSPRLIVLN